MLSLGSNLNKFTDYLPLTGVIFVVHSFKKYLSWKFKQNLWLFVRDHIVEILVLTWNWSLKIYRMLVICWTVISGWIALVLRVKMLLNYSHCMMCPLINVQTEGWKQKGLIYIYINKIKNADRTFLLSPARSRPRNKVLKSFDGIYQDSKWMHKNIM